MKRTRFRQLQRPIALFYRGEERANRRRETFSQRDVFTASLCVYSFSTDKFLEYFPLSKKIRVHRGETYISASNWNRVRSRVASNYSEFRRIGANDAHSRRVSSRKAPEKLFQRCLYACTLKVLNSASTLRSQKRILTFEKSRVEKILSFYRKGISFVFFFFFFLKFYILGFLMENYL